ncbi:hypothetical protein BMS3Abin14_00300 [bacterium BMS3Abin14]|nr:hypothetical protein BMS3Abin14_00300 [bacterium BMS3Abin14]HEW79153.1 hypothetical protein [Phycisphaerales bacterium]
MEKELEKVKSALDDFRKKLVDVVMKGKDEADRVTKSAQIRIEIGSLKRQKKDLFEELGEAFYGSYKKPGKKDEANIAELVAHVKEIDKRSAALNRQLKAGARGKAQTPKRRGRPAKGASTGTSKAAAPKRRGRPAKGASTGTSKAAAPKRRGRPPKAGQEVKTPDEK